jgi:bacillithiol system protein YtxJ
MSQKVPDIHSMEDFQEILKESTQYPVLLFKYSPICTVSFHAQAEFERFVPSAPETWSLYQINVVADKPTSRGLATEIGVTHESPQVLLFIDGKCVWNTSHSDITQDNLQKQTLQFG